LLSLDHLRSYDDIVDRDVYELDKEADEAHYREADGRRHGDLLELFAVRFCTPFDESNRVLRELLRRLHILHYLIHIYV